MKDGRPSFSAEVVAAMRALESYRPEKLRICYDPYAKHLIRPLFRLLARSRIISKYGLWYIEKKGQGFPAGIAARTRYIDDIVINAVENGAEQVVILGAGLDARAYRLEQLKNVRVFEVDFPATQAYKKARLNKIPNLETGHITYVPIDFNKQDLAQVLSEAGYDTTKKTVFTWEGVTMYLNEKAVNATMSSIVNNSAPGSTLFFDYFRSAVLDGRCSFPESVTLRKTSSFANAGTEHYTFGIEESEMETFLSTRGLQLLEHMNGDSLKERYFSGENAKRNVFRICGFVHAEVSCYTN